VLRHIRHKIGHFGDILQSQSLGILKKQNLTQQQQTTQEQDGTY